mgnify:CR=1 FL=1
MKKHDAVLSSVRDFMVSLKSCAKVKDLEKGIQIHVETVRVGLHKRNEFIRTALIDMYSKCGSIDSAQDVFDELLVHDVVSWTTLISAYVEHNHPERALEFFQQMKHEGVIPNGFTFVCGLKACGYIGTINKVLEMHAEIARAGIMEKDPVLGTAMIDMYAQCDEVGMARQVFDVITTRNAVSWTALVSAYSHSRVC